MFASHTLPHLIIAFFCLFLSLAESVKSILGRHTKILVKYMVKLETKGDKTENRVLVSVECIAAKHQLAWPQVFISNIYLSGLTCLPSSHPSAETWATDLPWLWFVYEIARWNDSLEAVQTKLHSNGLWCPGIGRRLSMGYICQLFI